MPPSSSTPSTLKLHRAFKCAAQSAILPFLALLCASATLAGPISTIASHERGVSVAASRKYSAEQLHRWGGSSAGIWKERRPSEDPYQLGADDARWHGGEWSSCAAVAALRGGGSKGVKFAESPAAKKGSRQGVKFAESPAANKGSGRHTPAHSGKHTPARSGSSSRHSPKSPMVSALSSTERSHAKYAHSSVIATVELPRFLDLHLVGNESLVQSV